MGRVAPSTVIDGLATKSDRIRALARAGYLRTEISRILGIRYQHVRKVLVDAGITDGLQRDVTCKSTAVSLENDPKPRPTHGDVLLRAGFQLLAEWIATPDGEIDLTAKAPTAPGVYAFLVDEFIVYVGLAQKGFRMRMAHYRRGHERQRTSARVKRLITAALRNGKRVKVLIAMPEGAYEWKGLPIDPAAGLEAGLIRRMCPEWNLMGKSKSNQHK